MGTEVTRRSILLFEAVRTTILCVWHRGVRMGGSPLLPSHVSQGQPGIKLAPSQQPQTHWLREAEMLF